MWTNIISNCGTCNGFTCSNRYSPYQWIPRWSWGHEEVGQGQMCHGHQCRSLRRHLGQTADQESGRTCCADHQPGATHVADSDQGEPNGRGSACPVDGHFLSLSYLEDNFKSYLKCSPSGAILMWNILISRLGASSLQEFWKCKLCSLALC